MPVLFEQETERMVLTVSAQDYEHLASSSPARRERQHHHRGHLGPHFPWAIGSEGQLSRIVQ